MYKKPLYKKKLIVKDLYLGNQPNFKYIIQFLRNGGERIRAIRLVMDVLKMSAENAQEYVQNLNDKVKMPEY